MIGNASRSDIYVCSVFFRKKYTLPPVSVQVVSHVQPVGGLPRLYTASYLLHVGISSSPHNL